MNKPARRQDMSGIVVGRLKVVEFAHIGKTRKAMWKCICQCGEIKFLATDTIKSGRVRSCGCLKREVDREKMKRIGYLGIAANTLDPGMCAFNAMYGAYKSSARKRGYDFKLTKEQFRDLTSGPCYFCGTEKSQNYTKGKNGQYVCNGIDRADNDVGYILTNCLSCCKRCNIGKHIMNKEQFTEMVSKIYNHLKLGEK